MKRRFAALALLSVVALLPSVAQARGYGGKGGYVNTPFGQFNMNQLQQAGGNPMMAEQMREQQMYMQQQQMMMKQQQQYMKQMQKLQNDPQYKKQMEQQRLQNATGSGKSFTSTGTKKKKKKPTTTTTSTSTKKDTTAAAGTKVTTDSATKTESK